MRHSDDRPEVTQAIMQRKHDKLKKNQAESIEGQQRDEEHRRNAQGVEAAREEQQEDSENKLQVFFFSILIILVFSVTACFEETMRTWYDSDEKGGQRPANQQPTNGGERPALETFPAEHLGSSELIKPQPCVVSTQILIRFSRSAVRLM